MEPRPVTVEASNDNASAIPLSSRPARDIFASVLGDAVGAVEKADIPYALIGGIASVGFGRQRSTKDIDLLVKPQDADRTLEALDGAGFRTEKTDPRWLYKGFKHNILVDIIFASSGGVYLDQEMLNRAIRANYAGYSVRFISPEDLLIMKAMVHDEQGPRHWHDALGLISSCDLDWDYLVRRARRAPRRILSLLLYAHSLDLSVPNWAIRQLYEHVYA